MRPAAGIPWPPPLQTTFARQGSSQTGLVTRESRLASAELMDAVGVAVRNASKHLAPVLSALTG